MSFEDLPPDWPHRPLTDPALVADVLDLIVTDRARDRGAVHVLLCDRDARLVLPIAVDEPDRAASRALRVRVVSTLLRAAEREHEPGSVLIAIARRGGLSATADDILWAESVLAALGDWHLLGVHVVTRSGSRPVPRASRVA